MGKVLNCQSCALFRFVYVTLDIKTYGLKVNILKRLDRGDRKCKDRCLT
jgi:hypothetical protein